MRDRNGPLRCASLLCTMAKKKASAPNGPLPAGLRGMEDLQRLLAKQDFKSEKDIKVFLEKMMKEGIPGFEPDDSIEEAEELVLEGYESDTPRAIELARQALELDHDCIGAYDLLGRCESLVAVRIAYFKRGIDVGNELYDDAFKEQHRGHFWQLHETRPYMRCMQGYAESLFFLGDPYGAITVWIDMIELNASDNLGIRQFLLLCMAALVMEKAFKEIDKKYKDDAFSSTLYNRALMAFTTQHKDADKLLRDAIQRNPHVVDLLLEADEADGPAPRSVELGSREEAMGYTEFAWTMWHNVPGCMEWVERVAKEPRKGR